MELPPELECIEGGTKLRDWFGYWPNFHDGKVISLHLLRRLRALGPKSSDEVGTPILRTSGDSTLLFGPLYN